MRTQRLDRRWGLAAALMLLVAGGCGKRQAGDSTIRFFDLPNVDVRRVPLLMALEELQSRGIKVERTAMSSGTLIADGLTRGEADIGLLNSQSMWVAITKGAKVRTIAKFSNPSTVVAARADIKGCRDLHEKRLGVSSMGGLHKRLLELHFERSCPGTDPQKLVIGESSARAAALLAGELDAASMPGEELLKLEMERKGRFHALVRYSKDFPGLVFDSIHVRQDWALANRAAVQEFLRALVTAQRRVLKDRELLIRESMKRLDMDREAAVAISDMHIAMPTWDRNGGPREEEVRSTIEVLQGIGDLPRGVAPADLADLSYLKEVLDRIGRE